MRLYPLAFVAGAIVLGACSSGENKTKDTTAAPTNPPPATTPGTTPAPPAGGDPAAPATGATHEVKMYGDEKGYRFEPKDLTIKSGDAVKFTVVNGGPHNIAFDPATVPADSKNQLNANMIGEMSELSSPMLMNPGENYTISFGNIKAGKYPFHCTPHLQMGMTGTIAVQ